MQRPVLGGRYELGTALGSGGFGTVFRARDRRAGIDVAVKLVAPGLGSEAAAQRLRREGAIVRRVTSRHVARVFDSGEDENGVWLVAELVEGGPLTVESLGRPLLPHEVLRVARVLLEGLAAVHAAGVVHGDVKPSNVITPRGPRALDGIKIVDFGLARVISRVEVAASVGVTMTRDGTVIGTARYMAPEVLDGGEPTASSDLYSAGLLLFELLDDGPVFPVGDARAQLRARLAGDPYLEERVPEPLSDVFARLLARDPAARYRDGTAAHAAVADLDTAPVSVSRTDETALAPSRSMVTASPPGRPTAIPSVIPSSAWAPARGLPDDASTNERPSMAPSPSSRHPEADSRVSRPSAAPIGRPSSLPSPPSPSPPSPSPPSSPAPASARPKVASVPARPPSERPGPISAPLVRLTSLPGDGVVALRETLRHLDLPMLDALARRERGNAIGRIARAVALALRLEVDAAALILEPLAMQSDVARAIGAAVLAPRARRVTRARVDSDREDRWVETIDPELAAMLVALAASLSGAEDAARDAQRCARALTRLEAAVSGTAPSIGATRTTVRVAQATARVRRGEIDRSVALDLVAPLATAGRADAPFHDVVRALSAGALSSSGLFSRAGLSGDEPRIAAELERAEKISADTGITLLDACAATALGRLRATMSPRDEQALLALERAGTLLARSDAPSLEHEAEQHRAVVLIALGRFADAIVHFRAAREAAHGERAGELEALSTAFEAIAQLGSGDARAAEENMALLTDARLATTSGRTGGFAWGARALAALVAESPAAEVLAKAESCLRARDRSLADASAFVATLRLLLDVVSGVTADPSTIERHAAEHGTSAFYWLDLLAAVVRQMTSVYARTLDDALVQVKAVVTRASGE